MSSLRVSVHVTGLLNRSASFASTGNSAYIPAFAPKPPPTSGAITRIVSASRCNASASLSFKLCGICVAQLKVKRPSSPQIAAAEFGSSGAPATRWFTYRPRTT